jgi:hypothetical protein
MPSKKPLIGVRVDRALYERIVTAAREEDRTPGQFIARQMRVVLGVTASAPVRPPVVKIQAPIRVAVPEPVPEPEPEEETDDEQFERDRREFDPDVVYLDQLKKGVSADQAYEFVKTWLSTLDLPEDWEPEFDTENDAKH